MLRQTLFEAHPHLMRLGQITPADAADIRKLATLGGNADKAPFKSSVEDFYSTNPITRASPVMAECSALAQGRARGHGGGVGATMAAFISDYVWPLVLMVAESILLLVVLLIVVAYVLLADRKIWAAVQIRRGPNVVGPWGLFQSFADLIKFVLKEPVIPAGANKGVFLLAPFITCVLAFAAWAVIPVNAGWVISNINVGILYIFAISSLGVYGVIMAGWASNSKYPLSRRATLGGADGVLRSLDRLCDHYSSALRRLAQSFRHCRSAEFAMGPGSAGTGCRCSRC